MLNLNIKNWKMSNNKVWLYWLRVFWNNSILFFQSEIDQQVGCHGAPTTLSHKKDLKWISAAIHETIRLTCSPIVPHVATQNSTIGGKISLPTQKAISVCPISISFLLFKIFYLFFYRLQCWGRHSRLHQQPQLEHVTKTLGRARSLRAFQISRSTNRPIH